MKCRKADGLVCRILNINHNLKVSQHAEEHSEVRGCGRVFACCLTRPGAFPIRCRRRVSSDKKSRVTRDGGLRRRSSVTHYDEQKKPDRGCNGTVGLGGSKTLWTGPGRVRVHLKEIRTNERQRICLSIFPYKSVRYRTYSAPVTRLDPRTALSIPRLRSWLH
jgi:hypothetical protein